MRVIIQRVTNSEVTINGLECRKIGKGLLVLAGFEDADDSSEIEWMCGKIVRLRIFDDDEGVMNLSVQDIKGDIMVISQFTLHASTKKGNRPSYIRASKPEIAVPLYKNFLDCLEKEFGKPVVQGEFGADMKINLLNDGPVTIFIDSKNKE